MRIVYSICAAIYDYRVFCTLYKLCILLRNLLFYNKNKLLTNRKVSPVCYKMQKSKKIAVL